MPTGIEDEEFEPCRAAIDRRVGLIGGAAAGGLAAVHARLRNVMKARPSGENHKYTIRRVKCWPSLLRSKATSNRVIVCRTRMRTVDRRLVTKARAVCRGWSGAREAATRNARHMLRSARNPDEVVGRIVSPGEHTRTFTRHSHITRRPSAQSAVSC